MKKIVIIAGAMLLLSACSSTSTEEAAPTPASTTVAAKSATGSASAAPSAGARVAPSREDTAGYLAATRKGTLDEVSDAKLLEIGRTLCTELRRGEWKKTVLDDSPAVEGISVQMRINAGFAAVHYLCTDQEADYLRRTSGG